MRIDPIELRRRNAIAPADFPYINLNGSILDSGNPDVLLQAAREESRWSEFPARAQAAAGRKRIRGIACALFVEPCGGGFVGEDQVMLEFKGEKILAHVATTSNCKGHETVFPDIVAGLLVFPYDQALEVLRGYRDFVESAPEELNVWFVSFGLDVEDTDKATAASLQEAMAHAIQVAALVNDALPLPLKHYAANAFERFTNALSGRGNWPEEAQPPLEDGEGLNYRVWTGLRYLHELIDHYYGS